MQNINLLFSAEGHLHGEFGGHTSKWNSLSLGKIDDNQNSSRTFALPLLFWSLAHSEKGKEKEKNEKNFMARIHLTKMFSNYALSSEHLLFF